MSTSIFGNNSAAISPTVQASAEQPKVAPAAVAPQAKPAAHDSIQISASAHVHLLKASGYSVQQIAANLGMSSQVVSTYLGITGAKK
ncbi:MAG: hypothetical protein ABI383_08710 [Acidobacteriaceae bacterium]